MPSKDREQELLPRLRVLSRHPLITLGLALIVCAAAFASYKLYQAQIQKPRNQEILKQLDLSAETLATEVEDFVDDIKNQLIHETQQKTLIQALVSNDANNLTKVQRQLLQTWPLLSDVAILKNLADDPSYSENFIATDLLRQTALGKSPPPVAMNLNKQWVIYIATPIFVNNKPDENTTPDIVGSLLATFSINILKLPLEQKPEFLGHTEILQTAKGFTPRSIVSFNEGPSTLTKLVPIQSIPGWQLSYSATTAQIGDTPPPSLLFLFSVAGIIALTIALIALLLRYSHRVLKLIDNITHSDNEPPSPGLSPEELNKLINETLHLTDSPTTEETGSSQTAENQDRKPYPPEVFRNYDIRGRAKDQITVKFAEALGKTLGGNVLADKQSTLAVATDGRTTGPELHEALIEGILSTGCNVVDLGCVPTPVFNFGLYNLSEVSSGVIVTASHNPSQDNGFKIIINQEPMKSHEIARLANTMSEERWPKGDGEYRHHHIVDAYSNAISGDIKTSQPLHIIVDGANGVMGPLAPPVLESLGCQVTPMYCDIDGEFPNHPPDPSDPHNLADLITMVRHENADLGLAFDGDGDRLVAVSGTGRIVWPDELLMIFARDILNREPDARVVFDVKSTRRLAQTIINYGGRPIMCKTGHSFIRRKMQEIDAILGGEYSGHIFFKDRWFGFDDGLYAAARLIEIMGLREQSLDQIVDSFEHTVATPELKVPVPEDQKFGLIKTIANTAEFKDGTLNDIDGLRIEFADGWGLIRASNTSSCLTLRFEANSNEALKAIQDCFKEQISPIIPDATLPF